MSQQDSVIQEKKGWNGTRHCGVERVKGGRVGRNNALNDATMRAIVLACILSLPSAAGLHGPLTSDEFEGGSQGLTGSKGLDIPESVMTQGKRVKREELAWWKEGPLSSPRAYITRRPPSRSDNHG